MTTPLDPDIHARLVAGAAALSAKIQKRIVALHAFDTKIMAQLNGFMPGPFRGIFEEQHRAVLDLIDSCEALWRDAKEQLQDLRAIEDIPTPPEHVTQVLINPLQGAAVVRAINDEAQDSRLYQRPLRGHAWIDDEDYEKHGDDPHDQDIYYNDDEDDDEIPALVGVQSPKAKIRATTDETTLVERAEQIKIRAADHAANVVDHFEEIEACLRDRAMRPFWYALERLHNTAAGLVVGARGLEATVASQLERALACAPPDRAGANAPLFIDPRTAHDLAEAFNVSALIEIGRPGVVVAVPDGAQVSIDHTPGDSGLLREIRVVYDEPPIYRAHLEGSTSNESDNRENEQGLAKARRDTRHGR